MSEPISEALHLRRLIEQQPACLMRVGIDGLLLAVNEAALRLLGSENLAQVLGSKLTSLIMPRQHEEWDEFIGRVRDGASTSLECDLTDLSGVRRTMLLQGVPLLDHPDGVPSMILTARDISAPRRLEAALRERESNRELDDLQRELQHGFPEPAREEVAFDDREVDLQPLIAPAGAEASDLLQLRQTLTEEHQAALLMKEQEAQQLLDGVRAELEQALAEQQRLTTLLGDREIGHERLVAAHAAEWAQLQQTLADERQSALLIKERESQQLLDDLRSELARTIEERAGLAALLEERESHLQRVVADHAAELARLQQTQTEQYQALLSKDEEHRAVLLSKARESRESLDALRTELDQALVERQRLSTMLEENEVNHKRIVAEQAAEYAAERTNLQQIFAEEHQLALVNKERETQEVLDNLRIELDAVLAERQRLAARLEEIEASHQRDVATHAAERARLQQTLAEEHQLALLLKEREARQQLDKVRIELEQAVADRQRFAAMVDEREINHQRIVAGHASKWAEGKQAIAAAAARQAEIEKALADQRVELETVMENARNLESVAAAGHAAIAVGRELQTVVAAVDARAQHLLGECALDAPNRHVIEALRVDSIEAASLARQILQIQASTPVIANSSTAGTAHVHESGDAGTEL